MKKITTFVAVAFAVCSIFAADAPAAFRQADNLLTQKKEWNPLSATGKMLYQPDGSIVLTISDTSKASWFDIGFRQKITVAPGEKLTVTIEARGAGALSYGVSLNKAGNNLKRANLTKDYKKYTSVFDFAAAQKILPQQGMLKCVLSGKTPDTKAEIRSFSFALT